MQNKLLFIVLFLILTISCVSVDVDAIDNLNNGEIKKIGHAGMGFTSLIPFNFYPSNSFGALEKALVEEEADGIEVDIHMTADKEFILYHDKSLNSKSNSSGYIEQKNYLELLNVKYKVGFPYDIFQSENLIGLDSAINFIHTLPVFPELQFDLRSNCECFSDAENSIWEQKMIQKLSIKLIELKVPSEKIRIITNSMTAIKLAEYIKIPQPMSLEIYDTVVSYNWAIENKVKSLTIKHQMLSKEFSKKAHDKGIEIITFAAKSDRGNKRLIELNPDYIQTNNLSSLNKLLQ